MALIAPGAAEASSGHAGQTAAAPAVRVSLEARLERKLAAVRKYRGTVRFFRNHPALLRRPPHRARARAALRRAHRRLARLAREVAALRRALARQEARRRAALPPRAAICAVFGRYCREALAVAWCESRLSVSARNGQYLGLFQMGWRERRVFGHGATAFEQAAAAYRYFVLSGRDWSPWGCKPWYA